MQTPTFKTIIQLATSIIPYHASNRLATSIPVAAAKELVTRSAALASEGEPAVGLLPPLLAVGEAAGA